MKTIGIKSNSKLSAIAGILTNETFLYVIKRLLQGILTLFLASLLSFIIIDQAPGDFLDTLKGNPAISQEQLDGLIKLYGLDQPWYVQYWSWLVGVVTRFEFGYSYYYKIPVTSVIWPRVGATLLLAVASIFVTWAIAIPLGILSAVKQNTLLDRILRTLSYIGQGFPSFIAALLLLFFAQSVSPLFPVGNMESINHSELSRFGKIIDIGWHMILPTIALSLTSFAGLQRLTRGQLLDVLRQDYIQTARAKGLPENRVFYVHALRNAINPLITLLGFEFASLLSGSFIAEYFFNWPGLGTLTLTAVQATDTYLVMTSLTIGAAMLIIGNLLADLLLKVVDPRITLDNLK
ncbi:MAG: ABC transporter permease [Prochloraceae cyanobacterium]|nr:ABC transporter permease [Prochloraceae cyanobacterium]